MKAAAVLHALDQCGGFQQTLVHTGQHYDQNMSQVFVEELGLPQPDHNLEVGPGSHSRQTARIMRRFEPVIENTAPELVLVYGDVNSTLACALTCRQMGIRTAHVEAGLRSFDRNMPEEMNRRIVDQLADVHFTPSPEAGGNLNREGIDPQRIHFVGNVMVDTLMRLRAAAECRWLDLRRRLDLNDFVLVTLHRPENVDRPDHLAALLESLRKTATLIDVLFPLHPRTRQRFTGLGLKESRLRFHDPLGYLDFLSLQAHARTVVTDSGGVQEETTFLGVPCLTVRQTTERPVTIVQGTNRLFTGDPASLADAIAERLEEPPARETRPEKWDGRSGQRIAEVLSRASREKEQEPESGTS